MRPVRTLDLLLGSALGGALVFAGVLATRPPDRAVGDGAAPAARGAADPAGPLDPPAADPDTAPADAPLRRELRRLATVQEAWREREGYYTASAASLAYWPVALSTVSFTVDSAGESWTGSAYDPDARRQCAVRVGPAPDPYVRHLPEGAIACRTLSGGGESALWGPSPPTVVWTEGVGRARRGGSPDLQRLRAMQVAWLGEDEEDDGSDFVVLREGLGREPYPDRPGPRTATEDAYVRLADATWGDLLGDGRWLAVVHLVENTGGTAFDGYLAVVRPRAGRLVNGPPYYVGDRTRLLRLRAARGVVTVDLVARGERDPRCCPTDTLRLRLGIRGDSLVDLDDDSGQRLTAGHAAGAARTRL